MKSFERKEPGGNCINCGDTANAHAAVTLECPPHYVLTEIQGKQVQEILNRQISVLREEIEVATAGSVHDDDLRPWLESQERDINYIEQLTRLFD